MKMGKKMEKSFGEDWILVTEFAAISLANPFSNPRRNAAASD